MKKVSVIIPCYNVENYIEKCLRSILEQTYQNIEIIVINDGSTDTTDTIIKKYKPQIKYITQSNKGIGYTRNIGLQKATGDYILFVDADDFLNTTDAIENMVLEITKQDSDILFFRFYYYYNQKKKRASKILQGQGNTMEEIIYNMIKNDTFYINLWNKLIKRSLIEEHNICFEEQIYSEDFDFSLNLYQYAKKVAISQNIYYSYRQNRKGSLTETATTKTIKSMIYVINKWLNQTNTSSDIKQIYTNFIALEYIFLLSLVTKNNTDKQDKKWLFDHAWLLQYSLNHKVNFANRVYQLLGMKLLIILLKKYHKLKTKNILKL